MRLANLDGRAVVLDDAGAVDLERASAGRFPADPMAALGRWQAVREWAAGAHPVPAEPIDAARLGPPVPRPTKVFGVGMNYRCHAAEAGLDLPERPLIFTKFPSCLVGPRADVRLSSTYVDWEVELVVVIGRHTGAVSESEALGVVAGYMVGQDISDRKLQFSDTPPQFSLGKSIDTFGPTGPAVVTLDELADPLDLGLSCRVDDEQMQNGRTRDMVFGVPALVAYLSRHCTLEPGDLVFTGTPAGVGSVRRPRRYLVAGEVVTSTIEGLGTMVNRCVPA